MLCFLQVREHALLPPVAAKKGRGEVPGRVDGDTLLCTAVRATTFFAVLDVRNVVGFAAVLLCSVEVPASCARVIVKLRPSFEDLGGAIVAFDKGVYPFGVLVNVCSSNEQKNSHFPLIQSSGEPRNPHASPRCSAVSSVKAQREAASRIL
jgi:hypothetical protein